MYFSVGIKFSETASHTKSKILSLTMRTVRWLESNSTNNEDIEDEYITLGQHIYIKYDFKKFYKPISYSIWMQLVIWIWSKYHIFITFLKVYKLKLAKLFFTVFVFSLIKWKIFYLRLPYIQVYVVIYVLWFLNNK